MEEAAEHVRRFAPRVNTAFYHGGEPIRILRPFLDGGEQKPYFLAMTAAGQSALNVRGLDTVIIDDVKFFNVIDRGRNVLTQEHLGANEILQMAGRVHGRVKDGRVFILSDRDIQFEHLQPTEPEFQLAGDSERVAMPDADTVWPIPLTEMLSCLERAGLVIRWQEDWTRSHAVMADSLLGAFADDAEDIAGQIGHRALDELLSAQALWRDWLRDGRVRKHAVVAEKA